MPLEQEILDLVILNKFAKKNSISDKLELTDLPTVTFSATQFDVDEIAQTVAIKPAILTTGGTASATDIINTLVANGVVVTPIAPTNLIVDDTANTATFTPVSGYAATAHEYSTNSGTSWTTCTGNVINIGDVAIAVGALQVRVKAGTNINVGPIVSNTTPFTVSASATVLVPAVMTGLTEAPVGTYKNTSGSSLNGTFTQTLGAGVNGIAFLKLVNISLADQVVIRMQLSTDASWAQAIANTTNITGFSSLNNVTGTGPASVVGLYYGVRRVGTTISVVTSTDGITWTSFRDELYADTNLININWYFQDGAAKYLYEPKLLVI